ncbi:MAG: hypothetical protein IJE25_03225 [Clostridia bacterium]|nr:hypothetical protein [Clostridia bacterium]
MPDKGGTLGSSPNAREAESHLTHLLAPTAGSLWGSLWHILPSNAILMMKLYTIY